MSTNLSIKSSTPLKNLDIINNQIQVGQVKTIHTGTHLDYVEMLFGKNLLAQFAPLEDNTIQFTVKNNDLEIPELSCKMTLDTIEDMIRSLKKFYSQLKEQNEL